MWNKGDNVSAKTRCLSLVMDNYSPTVSQKSAGQDDHIKEHVYSRRMVLTFKIDAILTIILGIYCVILYFKFDSNWLVMLCGMCTITASGISFLIFKENKVSLGNLYSQTVSLVALVIFCFLVDTPTHSYPRLAHLLFLSMALLGYINYKSNPTRIQLILTLLTISAFIFFSKSTFVPEFASSLPDEIRMRGGWIITIIATVFICAYVYLLQLEIEKEDDIVQELRTALSRQEFELFYQPQVDHTGRVIGAEALLRWKHPIRGYVSHTDFIPIAENSGLMPDIGYWVLTQACLVLSQWEQANISPHFTLSINISVDHFMQTDFVDVVLRMVSANAINPSRLKLEMTESMPVANIENISEKMKRLLRAGIQISLDDFGTGYSSLSYIKQLPITEIKIDRSFVHAALDDKRGALLARNIVQIGHDLNIKVLVEGIETYEQLNFFRSQGCIEFQGYLFGHPMPLIEFNRVIIGKLL